MTCTSKENKKKNHPKSYSNFVHLSRDHQLWRIYNFTTDNMSPKYCSTYVPGWLIISRKVSIFNPVIRFIQSSSAFITKIYYGVIGLHLLFSFFCPTFFTFCYVYLRLFGCFNSLFSTFFFFILFVCHSNFKYLFEFSSNLFVTFLKLTFFLNWWYF